MPSGSKLGRRAPWLGFFLGVLAFVVPKCPLCLAAWLAIFGVTLEVTGVVAPLLRPIGWALVLLSLGWAYRRLRARHLAG